MAGIFGSSPLARAQVPIRAALDERSSGLDGGCVSSTELRSRTDEAVGRPAFTEADTADVLVVLTAGAEGRATLDLEDSERRPLGTRTLSASSCSELTDALVLALSLMLDFSRGDLTKLREAQARANPPLPPEPPRAPAGPPPDHGSPWEYRAGVGAMGYLLLAPEAVFGPTVSIAALPGPSRLFELRGTAAFERRIAVADGSVRLDLWEVGAAVCPLWVEAGSGGLRPCAGVAVGGVQIAGEGFDEDAAGSSFLLRAGLELRLEQRLGRVVFGLAAEGSAPLVGYRALVSGGEVFRITPLVLTGSAGVAVVLR
jgi:hypothetical protein